MLELNMFFPLISDKILNKKKLEKDLPLIKPVCFPQFPEYRMIIPH